MDNMEKMVNEFNRLLESHPLICPECGGWKSKNEVICEDCRIAITVENTSIL